jgi:very-short-patch-repair endonuclease
LSGRSRSAVISVISFVGEKLIVIEVDGGQHSESARDEMRDRYLRSQGYRVMRFWNNDVLSNIEGVLTVIDEELREVSASKSG